MCLPGWTVYNRESCYLFVANKLTWSQAFDYCKSQNSILINLKEQAKYSFFKSMNDNFWVYFEKKLKIYYVLG